MPFEKAAQRSSLVRTYVVTYERFRFRVFSVFQMDPSARFVRTVPQCSVVAADVEAGRGRFSAASRSVKGSLPNVRRFLLPWELLENTV